MEKKWEELSADESKRRSFKNCSSRKTLKGKILSSKARKPRLAIKRASLESKMPSR